MEKNKAIGCTDKNSFINLQRHSRIVFHLHLIRFILQWLQQYPFRRYEMTNGNIFLLEDKNQNEREKNEERKRLTKYLPCIMHNKNCNTDYGKVMKYVPKQFDNFVLARANGMP